MGSERRISSIDLVRGLAMIFMALDHTREFFGTHAFRPEDITQTTPAWFFTRFITHICAPAFILLSGISIYLREQRMPSSTRSFVLKRGLLLIAIEILVMSLIITHGYSVIILGILWVIGISMVIFSFAIRIPRWLLITLGILMVAGHHLFPIVAVENVGSALIGLIYHTPFVIPLTPTLVVAYTIIPWLGMMILGYCIGPWFEQSPKTRQFHLLTSAGVLLLTFCVFRFFNIYGDPLPWAPQDRGIVYSVISFFNVNKYPASFLFSCLTVGSTLLLLALSERSTGRIVAAIGQAPLFYFILHFVLLSASSAMWTSISLGQYINLAIASPAKWPDAYEPSLPRVYVIWILLVILCYFPTRWFASYRRRSNKPWLSYL